MCLGIPGCVETRDDSGPLAMGTVSFGGAKREVCLAWVPEAQIGDFVIVHAGFAISVVDAERARETLEMLGAHPLEPAS